jgi:hypothetical protein
VPSGLIAAGLANGVVAHCDGPVVVWGSIERVADDLTVMDLPARHRVKLSGRPLLWTMREFSSSDRRA